MQDSGGQVQQGPPMHPGRSWLYLGIVVVVAIVAGFLIWWGAATTVQVADSPQVITPAHSVATPQLTTEEVIGGADHIWEIAFLPTKEMLFTERKGLLHVVREGKDSVVAAMEDVYARGEGGLLGLAVDPKFSENRTIYVCYNSTKGGPDVRIVRYKIADDFKTLGSRNDIVTGIPSNASGRHSGCRLAFGPDGYLWAGTGDTAQGDTAMQPKSLGGKILRVDRDGKAAPGNLGAPFDSRIYSYGHRNVQGIAFFPQARNGVLGISDEHGPSTDDEVNLLKGGNFGWAPAASGYNENVPMTDKARFPEAIDAIWSSGTPTHAISGATFLTGSQWKGWDGALAVTALKGKHLKIIKLDSQNTVSAEEKVLQETFGRLRTAKQGPDGNLYISTDNGSSDQIIRVTPH